MVGAKTPFYVVCRLHVLQWENDKCKLIAWFVLLFDSEMMSWARINFCCHHCSVIWNRFEVLLFLTFLTWVWAKSRMWTTCGYHLPLRFFFSHGWNLHSKASSPPPADYLEMGYRGGRVCILIRLRRRVFQLNAIMRFLLTHVAAASTHSSHIKITKNFHDVLSWLWHKERDYIKSSKKD